MVDELEIGGKIYRAVVPICNFKAPEDEDICGQDAVFSYKTQDNKTCYRCEGHIIRGLMIDIKKDQNLYQFRLV